MESFVARSACPYDCPDTCGLLVKTDGTTVYSVRGDPDHPVTRGFLCRKMQKYQRSVHHPERILTPLRRTGAKGSGAFAPLSWEEALEEISRRWRQIIDTHGAQSILPYSYSGVMSEVQRHSGHAFFHALGASELVRTICSSGKSAGWKAAMGATCGLDPREMVHSDLILIWGSDVAATRLHAAPILQEARRQGKPVLLIETYRSPTARLCDETVLIRPGTDGALALAMMCVLIEEGLVDRAFLAEHALGWDRFEPTLAGYTPQWAAGVTGVPAATIRRLARLYGQAAAPVILLGSGPSRHRNGAMTCRCISLLPALVGAWGKPGAGAVGAGPVCPSPLDSDRIQRSDLRKGPTRSVNMNQLAAALADSSLQPPIRSLYVYGSNPAAVTGNQKELLAQLGREDLFLVVHERFLTDTARFADIVLPATFSVEQTDIHTCYGYRTLQLSRAVIAPPGQCRSNWNTFRALAEAMGRKDPHYHRTEEEMVDHVLKGSQVLLDGLPPGKREDLLAGKAIDLPAPSPLDIRTPSGKIEFYRPDLAHPLPCHTPVEPDDYPLHLVAAPSPYTLNSTFGEREDLLEKRGELTLLIHPEDAAVRGVGDGDRILCRNELAQVEYTARVTGDVFPGTVVAHGIFPTGRTPGGLATNALVRERLSDLGEATTLNDNGVEVVALNRAEGVAL